MAAYEGIIDVFDENDLDFDGATQQGIGLILHQTGQGLYKRDSAYAERKRTALQKGFLWGAYHFLSAEDTAAQLDRFLEIEDGSDPRIGLAIDWEASKKGTMSHAELRRLVMLFNERMKPRHADRYPILYGGSIIRETAGILAGDPLLAKCPLWYVRYTANHPLEIPSKTWATYTLWQFADEHRQFGGPPPNVLPGADFSRFQGTEDDLRRAWPITGPGATGESAQNGGSLDALVFANQAAAIASQQWLFFGEQTCDLAGEVTRAGHQEGEDGFFQRVGIYWTEGVNISGVDGRDHGQPWSAAFISYVMKQAGAGARFFYSAQHSQYISRAIHDFLQRNPAAGYWGCRLTEAKPRVGDIVCWARQAGVDYDHQHNGNYMGHCDLVVAERDGQIDVIGGNVENSVTKRPLALNASGFLQGTVQNGETLFAIMQNRISTPVGSSPIA
jgi:Uncharacterized protein conserved in bacteria (DUF2272)/Glycosyl hydrolases family 25